MNDLPYNNNTKDECFYCSDLYTFHFSPSPDGNIQEGNSIESKKDPHDDNPKGCSLLIILIKVLVIVQDSDHNYHQLQTRERQ